MSPISRLRQRAFTLPELLVALATIVVFLALLLPAIQRIHEEAHRLQCANNLKHLALAAHHYASDHQQFPPG
jgi:prepilin-type N-terminal cleavage/methylation domain-containing protein